MAKIRFLDTDYFGSATVTAINEQDGAPVEASQDPDRNYQWSSGDATSTQDIEIDMGSSKACTAVAVANADRLGTGVIELYERGTAASPGTANLVATLPAEDTDRGTSFVFFGSQSARHWRLRWTNPTSANASATLGYAFLGTYFEPAINVSAPLDIVEVEPDEIVASVDRQRRTVARTPYSVGRWSWDDLAESDRDSVVAMHKANGVAVPIFVVLDTTRSWTCWLQWLSSALRHRWGVVDGRFSLDLDWEEAT